MIYEQLLPEKEIVETLTFQVEGQKAAEILGFSRILTEPERLIIIKQMLNKYGDKVKADSHIN